MNEPPSGPVKLARGCDAVQIPAGTPVHLDAGTEVHITQSLGGAFTVASSRGLFRIHAADADALGLTPQPESAHAPSAEFSPELVWQQLRTCYDPEIPVNIVDLGLIYAMDTHPLPDGRHRVEVKMTLTAQGCGMGPAIAADAQRKICALPAVAEADVAVVWDPPWSPARISPEGKAKLGIAP